MIYKLLFIVFSLLSFSSYALEMQPSRDIGRTDLNRVGERRIAMQFKHGVLYSVKYSQTRRHQKHYPSDNQKSCRF